MKNKYLMKIILVGLIILFFGAIIVQGINGKIENVSTIRGVDVIVDPDPTKILQNEIVIDDPVFGYRFRDNQVASKKNAIIIPQMGTSLPSTAWVKLEGLKYKTQASQTFGHGETEAMIIEVTCSVDNVYWATATSVFS